MNYSEITSAALGYSDREHDQEVLNKLDSFLKIVESRVNRVLKTQKMAVRVKLEAITGKNFYGLPLDFDGLRDIEVSNITGDVITPSYMSPEQINNRYNTSNKDIAYCIINDQLQIEPAQSDSTIELVYYRRVQELTALDDNWLSDTYPDCYIFGLLVEINSFVKDAEAAMMWDQRFKEAVSEIKGNDQLSRWSGPALQIREQ